MVDPQHAGLSITRQCRLVSITRSSFYDARRGESPLNLRLMRRIDEQFLETPFYGFAPDDTLAPPPGQYGFAQAGAPPDATAGGARALPAAPDVSAAPGAPDLSLPATRSADHAAEPRVVHGCHLHPPAAGLSVPGRRDGLGEPQGAVLAPVQTRSMRTSASRPCTRRSSTMALRRSSTATRGANSPASTSPTCSRRLAFASRWTARAAGWTTCSSSGCGDRSSTECVYLAEFATGAQARTGIGWWMDFYDRRRPHSALNDRTPAEAYTDDGADRSPGLCSGSRQPKVA